MRLLSRTGNRARGNISAMIASLKNPDGFELRVMAAREAVKKTRHKAMKSKASISLDQPESLQAEQMTNL